MYLKKFHLNGTSVLPEEISLEWSPHRISCTELRSWFTITLTLGRIRVKINIYMSRLHQRGDKFHRCLTQVILWSFFFSLIKNAADCSYKIALFQYWILLYYYDRKIFHNCFATYRMSLIIKKMLLIVLSRFSFRKILNIIVKTRWNISITILQPSNYSITNYFKCKRRCNKMDWSKTSRFLYR